MLYIFPCSCLPRQFVKLLLTFFCFQSSIQIFISISLEPSQLPSLPYFVHLFTIFISYFIQCFLCLFSFILSCTSSFHHHVSLSPFRFPNVTPSTVSAVLAFLLFCPTHQVTHPCLSKSWSPLV